LDSMILASSLPNNSDGRCSLPTKLSLHLLDVPVSLVRHGCFGLLLLEIVLSLLPLLRLKNLPWC
jgi:hypothetical protein